MRAWQLEHLGGRLELTDLPIPEARPGSVVVRKDLPEAMKGAAIAGNLECVVVQNQE